MRDRLLCGVRSRGGMAALELGAVDPALERFFGLPSRVDEVPAFAFHRPQQLEALETGHVLHFAGTARESRLELFSTPLANLDCVDFDNAHPAPLRVLIMMIIHHTGVPMPRAYSLIANYVRGRLLASLKSESAPHILQGLPIE